jgi:hypothetical protein
MKHKNREEWLLAAVAALKPRFVLAGYKVPAVHVSCGWPSSRGMSSKKPTIGECWSDKASDDKVHQIFISPRLDKPIEPSGVLPTLAHEIAHAVVGLQEKHNKVFKRCVTAIGLKGKATATIGSENFLADMKPLVKKLGGYPHSKLNPGLRPVKKQTTRLIKAECPDCGYNVRVTRKWLSEVGAPLCPCNQHEMAYEPAE